MQCSALIRVEVRAAVRVRVRVRVKARGRIRGRIRVEVIELTKFEPTNVALFCIIRGP